MVTERFRPGYGFGIGWAWMPVGHEAQSQGPFTMLGFPAGVKVMLRSAKEMNEDRAPEQAETLSVADEEDDRRD